MMDTNQWHLYAVEGPDQLAALAGVTEQRAAAYERRSQWCKAHGGTGETMCLGDDPVAMVVDAAVNKLKGWERRKDQANVPAGKVAWRPTRRSWSGKVLGHELSSLKVPGADNAAVAINAYVHRFANVAGVGQCLVQSQCFQISYHWVLRYPRTFGNDGHPTSDPATSFPGCRLLKASEYHAMLEADEAAAEGGR